MGITRAWKSMETRPGLLFVWRTVFCLHLSSSCVSFSTEQLSLLLRESEVAQLCLTLCDSMDCSPPGSSVHGDSPGKNTGVYCLALLWGIFPTQGSNPSLLCPAWTDGSLPLVPPGKLLWFLSFPHITSLSALKHFKSSTTLSSTLLHDVRSSVCY